MAVKSIQCKQSNIYYVLFEVCDASALVYSSFDAGTRKKHEFTFKHYDRT